MSKAPAARSPARPPQPEPPAKPKPDDDDVEDDEGYIDHAEKLAEAYDDEGGHGGRGEGGGGGKHKGAHGDHHEKWTLHSGKGTRAKLQHLEKAVKGPQAGK